MAEQFVSTTRLPELTQQLASGSPMSPIYIAPEDTLRVMLANVHATAQYAFSGRLLRTDGATIPLYQQLNKTTDGTAVATVVELTEGYLLSGGVFPIDAVPQRGECYAQMGLARGSLAGAPLFALLGTGYVSSLQPLMWPWSARNEPVLEAPGMQEVIIGSPAAGALFSLTVPPHRAWIVKSFMFRLVTSATVADRKPHIVVQDPVNLVFGGDLGPAQVASTNHLYSLGVGLTSQNLPGGANHMLALPAGLLLRPGWIIYVNAENLQAGDQIQAPTVTLESFQYWDV